MSDNRIVMGVMSAFADVETAAQYKAAKRRAGRLDVLEQFTMVDHAIAARRRLLAAGVTL